MSDDTTTNDSNKYKVEGCGKTIRTAVRLSGVIEAMAKEYPEAADRLGAIADDLQLGPEAELKRKPRPSVTESLEQGSRTAIQYFSTLHVDHSRDVVVPEGAMLKQYRMNPVVFLDHDYSKLIGTDEWTTKTERGLLSRTRYSSIPRADEVFTLKQEGILKSQSIGFLPVEVVRQGEKRFGTLVDRWRSRLSDIGEESHGRQADDIAQFHVKYVVVEHSDVALPDNAHAVSVAVSKALQRHPELTRDFFESDLGWKFLPDDVWPVDPVEKDAGEEAPESAQEDEEESVGYDPTLGVYGVVQGKGEVEGVAGVYVPPGPRPVDLDALARKTLDAIRGVVA